MDRLDELAIFVRIVEEGSLVRAAARLRRSPPAVTRALAALEDRIGVRLIDRTTRRLAPTEAGRALYDKARSLLADYEAATAGARDAPVRGLLRITAPVQFGRRHIAPIVARFLDAHDGVEVELLLNDRNIDLIEEGIDVALRIGPLADSTPVGAAGRPCAAAVGGEPGLSQAPRHAAHAGRSGASRGDPRHLARQHGMDLRRPAHGAPRADGAAARRRCRDPAARGARGPRHRPAPVLPGGRRSRGRQLVRLLQAWEPPPLPVHLVTKGRAHRAPKIDAFLDFAAKRLQALAGAARRD